MHTCAMILRTSYAMILRTAEQRLSLATGTHAPTHFLHSFHMILRTSCAMFLRTSCAMILRTACDPTHCLFYFCTKIVLCSYVLPTLSGSLDAVILYCVAQEVRRIIAHEVRRIISQEARRSKRTWL